MARPLALITGASAGIGKELARQFAAGGHDLILTARRQVELEKLANELASAHGVTVIVISVDLAESMAPQKLFDEVLARGLQVDVLVNNAGFGIYGPFVESDPARLTALVQVNITALTQLMRLFAPDMVVRGKGKILNVASTAAFQPGPLMAEYYASKAYVLSLSEAVAYELRNTRVTVTCLCPGPTATEFGQAAAMDGSKLFDGPKVMTAAAVAEVGYRGTMKGKRVVIAGFGNWLGTVFGRFVPRVVLLRLVERVQAKKSAD